MSSQFLIIITSLIQMGVVQLGELNLVDLAEKAQQVKVSEAASGQTLIGLPNNRKSAIYGRAEIIFHPIQNDFNGAERHIDIHESLGALGINDTDYQISSILFATYQLKRDTPPNIYDGKPPPSNEIIKEVEAFTKMSDAWIGRLIF
jgi:hypothetical protein